MSHVKNHYRGGPRTSQIGTIEREREREREREGGGKRCERKLIKIFKFAAFFKTELREIYKKLN